MQCVVNGNNKLRSLWQGNFDQCCMYYKLANLEYLRLVYIQLFQQCDSNPREVANLEYVGSKQYSFITVLEVCVNSS